jgi:hypothetical protein
VCSVAPVVAAKTCDREIAGFGVLWDHQDMEIFEIHITGDKSIISASKILGVKSIVIDLLKPDNNFYRTEFMTSDVKKFDSYDSCLKYVDDLSSKLLAAHVRINRVKIESPYYEHYRDLSCYIESHFPAKGSEFPVSRNHSKMEYLLATDRRYKKEDYDNFREQYKDHDIELCLMDSNIEEDFDWFFMYPSSAKVCNRNSIEEGKILLGLSP